MAWEKNEKEKGVSGHKSGGREWADLLEKGELNWADKFPRLEQGEKGVKDTRYARSFENNATQLGTALVDALERARKTGPDAVAKANTKISTLLRGSEKTKIDGCVCWLILNDLADKNGEDQDEALLIRILTEIEPFLAFGNPFQSTDSTMDANEISTRSSEWIIRCKDRLHHWEQKKKSTPFHTAAERGKAEAIRHMISSLKEHCKTSSRSNDYQLPVSAQLTTGEDRFIHILRTQDSSGETALQHAAKHAVKGGEENLKMLRELLAYPGIADEPDQTFTASINSGALQVVEEFLNNDTLRETFVTSSNIILAIEMIPRKDLPKDAPPHNHQLVIRRKEILYRLVEHATTSEIFNNVVVEKLIERNLKDVWEKQQETVKPNPSRLLHLAVYHQRPDFVGIFVDREKYPGTVTSKASLSHMDGLVYYPLWYNNKRWDSTKHKFVDRVPPKEGSKERDPPEIAAARAVMDRIRGMIVPETIKRTEKMQVLSSIMQESAEKVRELCFDISLFNSKAYHVYDFVHSLIHHKENEGLLTYEPTIKYVRFPALDVHRDYKETIGDISGHEHREVFDTLHWLKTVKDVTSVIELKVPDRLLNPHNEREIAKTVGNFNVEILDWRFLDMGLSIFQKTARKNLRGLHLYASGKRAVISHWFSKEGLESFPKLVWVHIHVIQETMTKTYCEMTRRYIMRKFNGLKATIKKEAENKEKAALQEAAALKKDLEDVLKGEEAQKSEAARNKAATLKKELEEALQEAAKRKVEKERDLDFVVESEPWNRTPDGTTDLEELAQRAFPKLAQFIINYRSLVLKRTDFQPTKVAIIDNGIMSMSPVYYDRGSRKAKAQDVNGVSIAEANGTGAAESDAEPDAEPDADDVNEAEGGVSNPQNDKSRGHRTLWSRIKEGCSFVDDDYQLSPWLFASHPHGTQMANLICALDPACQLYVAKVTDGTYGITPYRVAKAIDWARKKEVDIISMSFAILEQSDAVDTAISDANRAGIVMICSSHDEGSNISGAWPADSPETFTITACDGYGAPLRPSNEDRFGKIKYMVQGSDVVAGVIPFVDSSDHITGSSAATAIAAGMSSLITSCYRLAHPDTPLEGIPRRTKVERYLDSMRSSDNSKYLLLEKFGKIDEKIKEGEPISADSILNQFRKFFESGEGKGDGKGDGKENDYRKPTARVS